ncbi:MAG: hypothetical protein L3J44_02165 [Campylobacteraceae bacterium]|nr:hypothetical protein [Campylobacteraceae bacterium]
MTDRAFEDLERRCKKLKQKTFIKWFFGFIFFIIVAGVAVFLKFYESIPIKKTVIIKQNAITEKKVPKQKIPKKILPKPKRENSYDTITLEPTIVIPKVENIKKVTQKVIKKVEKKSIEKKEPPKIDIKVTSIKDEQSLLKENKNSENFDTTLDLAKYYYENGKYEKSIYFAKKANHYKPSSFKPWEYYSKSKMKQNKKSEAIASIKQFLSYFNSDDAIKLLQKLQSLR